MKNKLQPIIYVFLNKNLHMSVGKASAQAGHAVAMSLIELTQPKEFSLWRKSPHRTIIILEARNSEHIHNIKTYLLERNYPTQMVVDEGVNEIDPHSITALATSVLDKNNEHVVDTFSTFKLYKDLVKINLEYEK